MLIILVILYLLLVWKKKISVPKIISMSMSGKACSIFLLQRSDQLALLSCIRRSLWGIVQGRIELDWGFNVGNSYTGHEEITKTT